MRLYSAKGSKVKLIEIYTQDDDEFIPIEFVDGLNVIFASSLPDSQGVSLSGDGLHSVGKSFLCEMIDFILVARKSSHQLNKTQAWRKFLGGKDMYLQVLSWGGDYVLIKRGLYSKVFISVSSSKFDRNQVRQDDFEFDHKGLSESGAKSLLDNVFSLYVLGGDGFRKGLGYVYRRQGGYSNTFQVKSFERGSHSLWKPFLLGLIGCERGLFEDSYELTKQIKVKREARSVLVKDSTADELDALEKKLLESQQAEEQLQEQVRSMSFRRAIELQQEDASLEIEARYSELVNRRWVLQEELSQISDAQGTRLSFDIALAKQLFDDVEICFPNELIGSFNDLMHFISEVSGDRNRRLARRHEKISFEISSIDAELKGLDERREGLVSVRGEDAGSAEGYVSLVYRQLEKEKAKQARLKTLLSSRTLARQIDEQIAAVKDERKKLIDEIQASLEDYSKSEIFSSFCDVLEDVTTSVLGRSYAVQVLLNSSGNPELEWAGMDDFNMSEEEGATYKKLLSVCFDLSLAILHSSGGYYRFLIHDGVLEGVQFEKRSNLINFVREVLDRFGIQYIITAIEDDIVGVADQKLEWQEGEVRRALNDGPQGRLFSEAF